ncbi:hypothetical protein P153DRAFT_293707 [Dothidotthia symphoricarpi CBS 119687]|uniref:YDG domain-containing protein n=1 Tax=Dothidotthia symphoricarpi CBS 119687 TaxID=1392245 RepID=A0A6A6ABE5_9PLEO|nr:uncharacterized protein P153DRAFT_293707 [Dothidotthia symphoricarpi CBS 119687]KAF2128198.1 hypothetical protein P153DRAFT_293707 [Dothidotthia symphoricarpi CBS 119687]
MQQPRDTIQPRRSPNKAQVQTNNERRDKKEKHRREVQIQKENGNSRAQSPTTQQPLVAAESSAAGAVREAASTPHQTFLLPETVVYKYQAQPLPKWYLALNIKKNAEMKRIAKNRPQALSALDALKKCIGRCEQAQRNNPAQIHNLYEELRDYVHKAEIKLHVTGPIVRTAMILHPTGLPCIFAEESAFPSDLKSDSYQLYCRWLREDFDQNILRGIVQVKSKERNADRLDQAYKKKFPTTAKYYGGEGLVLGQWWPTQLCTVRDGAHGAAQGGISGETDKGAYSIVLSGGGYHDQDDGDVIEYSGTDGKDFKATDATLHMVKSAELGNQIRVIRSSQLVKKNKYRPEVGLRYDGLYVIKSFKVTDREKQTYRFHLERCPGQDPIRCEDNSSRRPTPYEEEEFRNLKLKDW